jgi:hypothetical protein
MSRSERNFEVPERLITKIITPQRRRQDVDDHETGLLKRNNVATYSRRELRETFIR